MNNYFLLQSLSFLGQGFLYPMAIEVVVILWWYLLSCGGKSLEICDNFAV